MGEESEWLFFIHDIPWSSCSGLSCSQYSPLLVQYIDHRNSWKFNMCFFFYAGRLTETPHRTSLPIFPHASQLKLLRLDHLLIHTYHLIISIVISDPSNRLRTDSPLGCPNRGRSSRPFSCSGTGYGFSWAEAQSMFFFWVLRRPSKDNRSLALGAISNPAKFHWIGLRENLQETMVFTIKIH